jgi:hypothetical protein
MADKRLSVALAAAALLAFCVASLESAGPAIGKNPIRLRAVQQADYSYELRADNDLILPSRLTVTPMKVQGLTWDQDNPYTVRLEAGDKDRLLFTVRPIEGATKISLGFQYAYSIGGDPVDARPEDYAYLLPFEHGTKHKLDQGYWGKASHSDPLIVYSLDFEMPIGTPVCAARAGLVFDFRSDSNSGGTSAAYLQSANYIRIRHDDGTVAEYAHLKQGGVAVRVGQRVEAGEVIGYSGNTGYSSGPHLHFDVSVPNLLGQLQTRPSSFLGLDGQAETLVDGRYYYSFHPGMPAFEARFGADLRAQDFSGYAGKADPAPKPALRTESYDDTRVLYIGNGTKDRVTLKITMSLRNLVSEPSFPLELSLEPGTEAFLCVLKPIEASSPFGYQIGWSY